MYLLRVTIKSVVMNSSRSFKGGMEEERCDSVSVCETVLKCDHVKCKDESV